MVTQICLDLLLDKYHIMQRGVLTPRNDTAHEINDVVMQRLPGEISKKSQLSCIQCYCLTHNKWLAMPSRFATTLN